MRRKITIMIFAILLPFTGCAKEETISLKNADVSGAEAPSESKAIYVYVCGAVAEEGVYELQEGSRVFEAIEAAGGFREDAAMHQVNQAQILEDEMKVYIPTMSELSAEESEESGKININTASKEQLMTIPGVGEAKANSIIEYREKNGGFQKIEEIMEISGIKEGLFQQMKDFIVI